MPSNNNPSPQVVVITGGSSGIGRATAHAFARRGACLVLAAREPWSLEDAARECVSLGAPDAIAVPTDVTDAQAVARLAERATEAFGRIDVWVNDAGVTALGRFDETPPGVFRRVVETNFFGCVNGARVALAAFRAQGHGVLINVASMLGVVAEPYASAYVSSKFAIRGFSESLRQELRDAPGIHVCTVLPAAMDTPIFQNAANHTPWPVKAVDPAYDPALAARAIVRLARRPRAEVVVGGFGQLLTLGRRIAPRWLEAMVGRAGPWMQFVRGSRSTGPRNGNLFTPAPAARHLVAGGWQERSTRPLLLAGGLLAAAAALLVWQARRAAGEADVASHHRLQQ